MKITNEFTVDIPIAQAWAILTDLEGVAPCLPGAQLTGVDGDVHQGTVKVKVGPVVSEFAGTARFVEKDEERYRGVIEAKGRARRSAAPASATRTWGRRSRPSTTSRSGTPCGSCGRCRGGTTRRSASASACGSSAAAWPGPSGARRCSTPGPGCWACGTTSVA